jgi:hypothetical protein
MQTFRSDHAIHVFASGRLAALFEVVGRRSVCLVPSQKRGCVLAMVNGVFKLGVGTIVFVFDLIFALIYGYYFLRICWITSANCNHFVFSVFVTKPVIV